MDHRRPATLLASLGTVTFTPIGGTTDPTTQLNSASLTADFVNRQASFNFNVTNLQYENTFVGTGSSGISSTSGGFAARLSTVTCRPVRRHPVERLGQFRGLFRGPERRGAGLTFVMGGVGSGQGVNGAVAFKR